MLTLAINSSDHAHICDDFFYWMSKFYVTLLLIRMDRFRLKDVSEYLETCSLLQHENIPPDLHTNQRYVGQFWIIGTFESMMKIHDMQFKINKKWNCNWIQIMRSFMGLSYLSCRLTTIILSCCASWNQSLLFSNFEESQDDNNIGLMKPHMDNIACFHPYLNTFIQKKHYFGVVTMISSMKKRHNVFTFRNLLFSCLEI